MEKVEGNCKKNWTEIFRTFTPILLFILSGVGVLLNTRLSTIEGKIDIMDTKIFSHLTNDDIHTPRGQTVSRDVFDQYSRTQEKDTERLYDKMCLIETMISKGKIK